MNPSSSPFDLARTMFGILFISLLLIACFWIIQPFVLGFSWAGMIVIVTWPLLQKLQNLCWNRRILAVIIMTLLLILLFVIPIGFVISSVVDNRSLILDWVSDPSNLQFPVFNWLKEVPLIGSTLDLAWHSLIADGGKILMIKIQPYVGKSTSWFIGQIANVGRFMLHSSLMVVFSALLYYKGEEVVVNIRRFALRLAPVRGDIVVMLSGQAIRAVALGVVVTALFQSILAGIGITAAGVNYAMLLTIAIFMSCLIQLGPLPILIPLIIWLYWIGDHSWGTILLVWSGLIATLDSVLRPLLIKVGANLPVWLILSGVIGGMLSFGMIGLFIGPVVLAVGYRLIFAWIAEPMNNEDGKTSVTLLHKEAMKNNKTEDGLEDLVDNTTK